MRAGVGLVALLASGATAVMTTSSSTSVSQLGTCENDLSQCLSKSLSLATQQCTPTV